MISTLGKPTKRQLLENALARSQNLQDFATNSQNFGSGYAGGLGLLAQGLTAGVSAYQEYKQRQELARLDAENNEKFVSFANTYGDKDLGSLAPNLSNETKQAYILSKIAPDLLNKVSNNQIPASIQEWEAFKKLPQNEQNQYMNLKRNIVGEGATLNASGNVETLPGYGQAGAQKKEMEQNAKNLSDLNFQPVITRETTKQKTIGATEGAEDVKKITAPQIIEIINAARKELPKATSGLAQKVVSGTATTFGISTEMDKADRKLEVIGGRLNSFVPRFEGPQSDKDVVLYKEMAGNISNKNIPYESRLAALDTIEELNKKYLKKSSTEFQAPMQKSTIIKRYNPQTGRIE